MRKIIDLETGEETEVPDDIPLPEVSVDDLITKAPDDLFGGPTLQEIFNGNH